jgi:sugar/nucleoside kinase (ribokinase family)
MKIVSRDEVLSWVSMMDGILLNSEEALYLGDATDVATAEENLAKHTPLVVIKLGSKGAMAINGSEKAKVSAVTTNVVDTTGAGKGVPSRKITAIEEGRDTLTSTKAYAEVMKKRYVSDVIVVTDPFHCARAIKMANDQGVLATCSPVQTGPNTLDNSGYRYLIREAAAYLAYITVGRRGIHVSDHLPGADIVTKVLP